MHSCARKKGRKQPQHYYYHSSRNSGSFALFHSTIIIQMLCLLPTALICSFHFFPYKHPKRSVWQSQKSHVCILSGSPRRFRSRLFNRNPTPKPSSLLCWFIFFRVLRICVHVIRSSRHTHCFSFKCLSPLYIRIYPLCWHSNGAMPIQIGS